MIKFENVEKRYGDTTVIKDLNMEINDAEIAVLIGPSGCGKTTTLKMINRLIEPSSGVIYINDQDILKADPIELRRNIGYVIQQIGLFPHMTVGQNIGLIPTLKNWPEDKKTARVRELMELVGMTPEEYMNRYPNELSGGQQQRIGVARALAADPDIILMDEPFSALDPLTRAQLQDELFNLQQELHKTIVFVTHDMDEALKLGDRICIMRDGEILQFDTPENLLRHPAHGFVEEFIGKKRMWQQPEYIKAEDIMITNPIKAMPNRTLTQALEIMSSSSVDSLIIVDDKNKLLGIVTAKQVRSNANKARRLEEIYKRDILSVKLDDSMADILKLMAQNDIGYVPVTDEQGRLRGLITRSSLVNVLGDKYVGEE